MIKPINYNLKNDESDFEVVSKEDHIEETANVIYFAYLKSLTPQL